ncbi:MAG: RidA family protein [Blastocatellia bacterium]|nr:RidA family protein [Blastocatellia bacterium]
MEKVQTKEAPTPAGHYSQGIVHNGLVYVSGQVAVDPETGELVTDSVEAQVERALQNVEAVLKAANSDLDHVLKMTIYVSGMELWGAVNATYAKILGEHRPARAIIPVGDFRDGLKVEIEAIASVKY